MQSGIDSVVCCTNYPPNVGDKPTRVRVTGLGSRPNLEQRGGANLLNACIRPVCSSTATAAQRAHHECRGNNRS
eukprot:365673-Chlamydomonas_euryale.AAC.7